MEVRCTSVYDKECVCAICGDTKSIKSIEAGEVSMQRILYLCEECVEKVFNCLEREANGARVHDDSDVKCPFFLSRGKRSVLCEGITRASRVNTKFESRKLYENHKHEYCDRNFRECPLYRIIKDRYDKGD